MTAPPRIGPGARPVEPEGRLSVPLPQPHPVMRFDGTAWRSSGTVLRGESWERAGYAPAYPELLNLAGGVTLLRKEGALWRWSGRG